MRRGLGVDRRGSGGDVSHQPQVNFLRHAESASAGSGIDTRDILVEVGCRRMVGGQEDAIGDIALDLAQAREAHLAGARGRPPTATTDYLGMQV
jgi:hypothetical protein